MLYQFLISIYVILVSLYIVFESISVAASTQLIRKIYVHNRSACMFMRILTFVKLKLESGKLCISARYLLSSIAALYLFRVAVDTFICALNYRYNFLPQYCSAIIHIDTKEVVYISAIFLGCWSRMVYRLFGDRRRTQRQGELYANEIS